MSSPALKHIVFSWEATFSKPFTFPKPFQSFSPFLECWHYLTFSPENFFAPSLLCKYIHSSIVHWLGLIYLNFSIWFLIIFFRFRKHTKGQNESRCFCSSSHSCISLLWQCGKPGNMTYFLKILCSIQIFALYPNSYILLLYVEQVVSITVLAYPTACFSSSNLLISCCLLLDSINVLSFP